MMQYCTLYSSKILCVDTFTYWPHSQLKQDQTLWLVMTSVTVTKLSCVALPQIYIRVVVKFAIWAHGMAAAYIYYFHSNPTRDEEVAWTSCKDVWQMYIYQRRQNNRTGQVYVFVCLLNSSSATISLIPNTLSNSRFIQLFVKLQRFLWTRLTHGRERSHFM